MRGVGIKQALFPLQTCGGGTMVQRCEARENDVIFVVANSAGVSLR
jgi:hypothetical protein